MNLKLSIIVTIYNKEKYLDLCLKSIQVQTCDDIDIILVDDGSTDNSEKICRKYVEADKRYRYVKQDNKGETAARARGLEEAKTEYVTFIDADDYIERDYVQALMQPYREEDYDLVTSGLIPEGTGKVHAAVNSVKCGKYTGEQLEDIRVRMVYDSISGCQGINHSMSGKVFRKKILQNVFSDLNRTNTVNEDGLAVFYYLCFAEKIEVLPYSGYHYVQCADSYIHVIDRKKITQLSVLKDEYIRIADKFEIYEKAKYAIENHISWLRAMLIGRADNMDYGKQFVFPKELLDKDAQIVVYGAGKMGKQMVRNIKTIHNWKIVGWLDRNYNNFDAMLGIRAVEDIADLKYDYVFVAVDNVMAVHDIILHLMDIGVPYKKIWQLDKVYMYTEI